MGRMIVDPKAVIASGMAILPSRLDTPDARVQLYAIGRQESRFEVRRQHGNGPAAGFWQFERGGGVVGVMSHRASKDLAITACSRRGVRFDSTAVWRALQTDDVLATVFARLLLLTDPAPLPRATVENASAGWQTYVRNWRPGRPHPETWARFWAEALAAYDLETA